MTNYVQPYGFHWRDGWHFARKLDGSVEVRLQPYADGPSHIRFTIPALEWASIVSSVSKDSETYDRWMAAQEFHGKENPLDKGVGWDMMPITSPTGKVFKLKEQSVPADSGSILKDLFTQSLTLGLKSTKYE